MKKIFIWGTGMIATRYLNRDEISKYELCGFIETTREKDFFCNKRVYEPGEIADKEYDYILVLVSKYSDEIRKTAQEYNLDEEKMLFYDPELKWIDGSRVSQYEGDKRVVTCKEYEYDKELQMEFPVFFELANEAKFYSRATIATYRNGYDDIDDSQMILKGDFANKIYRDDYFRYRSFEFVANQIIEEEVAGDCAEVGVFRGYFSKLINAKIPHKKLYMFDTFEGFDQEEIKAEVEKGYAKEQAIKGFSETSEEFVLGTMLYPEKCIIRKGFFPETASGLEDNKYAFVSIDVDLEESIYQSLLYFYPRLSDGGFIFLHDYNNRIFFGVKRAVERFESHLGSKIVKVPIADQGGTLVITKR